MTVHTMRTRAEGRDPESVASQRTVLVVDDSPPVRAGVTSFLARAGWDTVLVAGDAGEGLALARSHQPAAIVLDNRMPGRLGIDVLGELRDACPTARIVMHSSDDTPDVQAVALRRGADAYVSKGQPLDRLVIELDRAS
jgi:DNA-binding NarL/FixJ family response regulator